MPVPFQTLGAIAIASVVELDMRFVHNPGMHWNLRLGVSKMLTVSDLCAQLATLGGGPGRQAFEGLVHSG
jgi:hypothetical protein